MSIRKNNRNEALENGYNSKLVKNWQIIAGTIIGLVVVVATIMILVENV